MSPAAGAAPAAEDRLPARLAAALRGARWALAQRRAVHALLKDDGLNATVAPPPTTQRGSLFGARVALWLRHATCLERSLIIQRWFAARGTGLDVIVGVRNPTAQKGAMAHAWVEHFDPDFAPTFLEIRRIDPPDGVRRWQPKSERQAPPAG